MATVLLLIAAWAALGIACSALTRGGDGTDVGGRPASPTPSPQKPVEATRPSPTPIPSATPVPTPTGPPLVRDQDNLAPGGLGAFCPGDARSLAQSFTPGASSLAAVEIGLRPMNIGEELPTTVNIRAGLPSGEIVATSAATIPMVDEVTLRFNISPPAAVVPGETYFIEWIEPAGDRVQWRYTDDRYPGGLQAGCGEVNPEMDLVFATYTLREP